MKTYLKIGVVILAVLLVFIFVIKSGIEMNYNNELEKINNSRIMLLNEYKLNKGIAESYLEVYKIRDDASYKSVKNSLYDKLSPKLQKEYFPTVNYEGLALHKMTVTIKNITGTNYALDKVNTFMVEYNLKGVNYNQDITNLIDMKNGQILKVTRIK
jgi:hypothetical protein